MTPQATVSSFLHHSEWFIWGDIPGVKYIYDTKNDEKPSYKQMRDKIEVNIAFWWTL